MEDAKLFAPWFRDPDTWAAWRAYLVALFALPMTPDQLEIYRRCTGRADPPITPATEAWLVCGRRSGKSFILALIAVYLAVFNSWRQYLAPGERATVMVIAADRKQARVIMRYVKGLLLNVPMIAKLVQRETMEAFDLSDVTIEVQTASYRTTRGYALVAALADEIAFWRIDEEAADPDYAVLDALRPGMATIPGAMLLCASSPYSRKGALWDAHRRHFGVNGDPVLVWQAPTRTMNSTVPQRIIDEASERDPAVAAAEYLAMFRSDLEGFVRREVLDAAVSRGVFERPWVEGIEYYGFADPSGGSRDSFCAAVSHIEGDRAVLDAVRERKAPFAPSEVVAELSSFFKSYGVTTIGGDRYSAQFVVEQFRQHEIEYRASALSKSEIYLSVLPSLNSGLVSLLHDQTLINQFAGLERRTGRGGARDTVDHAPAARDDVCNAASGALEAAFATLRHQEMPIPVAPKIFTDRNAGEATLLMYLDEHP
jgi:hypothetical protein